MGQKSLKCGFESSNSYMAQQQESKSSSKIFRVGSLWNRVRATTHDALRNGAIEPIDTEATYCVDCGVQFLIRVISSLRGKPPGDDHNPFLPYEKELYVADALDSHVCVLNKYNVVDHHLLIVTREFQHQETTLTRRDFHALWRCMREYDSLGFYNSGPLAGASQKHKHLQLVPLPLGMSEGGGHVTIRSWLDARTYPFGEITHVTGFPFRHAFVRWEAPDPSNPEQFSIDAWHYYRQMMGCLGIRLPESSDELIETPYNLLVSRRWMLLVPRLRECFGEISLNSLAFIGALLVQDAAQREQLCHAGPFAALQSVTFPAE